MNNEPRNNQFFSRTMSGKPFHKYASSRRQYIFGYWNDEPTPDEVNSALIGALSDMLDLSTDYLDSFVNYKVIELNGEAYLQMKLPKYSVDITPLIDPDIGHRIATFKEYISDLSYISNSWLTAIANYSVVQTPHNTYALVMPIPIGLKDGGDITLEQGLDNCISR